MKVKNVLIMLGAVLCANLAMAQNPVMKKYSDNPDVRRVYISEDMIKMVTESPSMIEVWKSMGLTESPLKLESFELFVMKGKDKDNFMKKDFNKLVTKQHKELLRASEGTSKVATIYGLGERTSLREMVFMAATEDNVSLMLITGNINFDEMIKLGANIVKNFDMSKLPSIPGMPNIPGMSQPQQPQQ